MASYCRLARTERYQIAALLQRGDGIRTIARTLNRSPSSICRELKRNEHPLLKKGVYWANLADQRAERLRRIPKYKLRSVESSPEIEAYVRTKLQEDWSPEQISGRLKRGGHLNVPSYSSLYRFIYRDALRSGQLWKKMRKPRACRARRNQWENRLVRGEIQNRVWIDERPKIINERARNGDYERDTIQGSKTVAPLILSIVDRRSRMTYLSLLPEKTAQAVHESTVSILAKDPHLHSITNDNGCEFTWHERTSKALGCAIYFSHPYHSWERGTNENTNGLIRQYFPKKKELTQATAQQVQAVETLLNHRPRKCLGYQTPYEVHHGP